MYAIVLKHRFFQQFNTQKVVGKLAKKLTCIICAVALCLLMCPLTAAAEDKLTVSLRAVGIDGSDLSGAKLEAGDRFRVQFVLSNYDGIIGNGTVGADLSSSVYDGVAVCAVLSVDFDRSVAAPVTDGNGCVWSSPFDGMVTYGSLITADTATGLRLIAQTDDRAGERFFIDAAALARSNGVMFEMEFRVADNAAGSVDKTASITPIVSAVSGITLNTKAAGSADISTHTVSDLGYVGGSITVAAASGQVPGEITGSYYPVKSGCVYSVSPETTASELIGRFNESGYLAVYDGQSPVSGTTRVKTGMTLKLMDGVTEVQSLTIAVAGDANGDGAVNIKDVILIRQYIVNFDYDTETSTVSVGLGAYANTDGGIDIKDVILIRQYIVNFDYDTQTSSVTLGK